MTETISRPPLEQEDAEEEARLRRAVGLEPAPGAVPEGAPRKPSPVRAIEAAGFE